MCSTLSLMKVIPETWCVRLWAWWRLYQKRDVSDFEPDEGYTRNVMCSTLSLMKVIPETWCVRLWTWWRLYQKRDVFDFEPDEGYTRNVMCSSLSLMKVIPETWCVRLWAWWRLYQKLVVHTKLDTHVYLLSESMGIILHWVDGYHPPSSQWFCVHMVY
jgi:hypothetical protein